MLRRMLLASLASLALFVNNANAIPIILGPAPLNLGGDQGKNRNGKISDATAQRLIQYAKNIYNSNPDRAYNITSKLIKNYQGRYLADAYYIRGKAEFIRSDSYSDTWHARDDFSRVYDEFQDSSIVKSGSLAGTIDKCCRYLISRAKERDPESYGDSLDFIVSYYRLYKKVSGVELQYVVNYLNTPYQVVAKMSGLKNFAHDRGDGYDYIADHSGWGSVNNDVAEDLTDAVANALLTKNMAPELSYLDSYGYENLESNVIKVCGVWSENEDYSLKIKCMPFHSLTFTKLAQKVTYKYNGYKVVSYASAIPKFTVWTTHQGAYVGQYGNLKLSKGWSFFDLTTKFPPPIDLLRAKHGASFTLDGTKAPGKETL